MDIKSMKAIQDFKAAGIAAANNGDFMGEQYHEPLHSVSIDELINAGIPKRYRGVSFDKFLFTKVPEQVRPAYRVAEEYAHNFEFYREQGTGLILEGPPGGMKTTLACCIARSVIERYERGTHGRPPVYFISMPELFDRLLSRGSKEGRTEQDDFYTRVQETRLLVLDDFGEEYPAGWILNKVNFIISHRYDEMLPTIITTNLLPQEMKGRYAGRLIDRLRSTYKVVIIGGESLRPTQE